MSAANNWTTPQDMSGWMRHQEKRMMHEERRPLVSKASDIMGPGIAPQAVEIPDWSGAETEFNGFYFSRPGAPHSPDTSKWWLGTNLSQAGEFGLQHVWDYRSGVSPVAVWVRYFQMVGDTRLFGTWSQVSGGGTTTPGDEWFTVSAAPSGTLGEVGDFALHTGNGDYYEKTGASSWTLRGNLRGPTGSIGPKGDPGLTGPEGPEGPTGPAGPAGTPGSVWYNGADLPASSLGVVGDYYLRSTGSVYKKTDATTWTWQVNITGPEGPQGEVGPQGEPGSSALPIIGTHANRPASSSTIGQTYYETDTLRTYIWDGTAWAHQAGETAGVVKGWGGASLPAGYLWGKGAFVSQTTYPELYAALGHAYNGGVDPGNGTFKLPDLTDRSPVGSSGTKALGSRGGSSTVTIGKTNVPPHVHDMTHSHTAQLAEGDGLNHGIARTGTATGWFNSNSAFISGSTVSNTGNGSADGLGTTPLNVQNPYQSVNYIVKF